MYFIISFHFNKKVYILSNNKNSILAFPDENNAALYIYKIYHELKKNNEYGKVFSDLFIEQFNPHIVELQSLKDLETKKIINGLPLESFNLTNQLVNIPAALCDGENAFHLIKNAIKINITNKK